MLRFLRILLALIIFIPLTFHFLDFDTLAPSELRHLELIQFIPSVVHGLVVVVGVILLITLLFGRVYCSVICPLGIFQDCVSWISKKVQKKKRYKYSPAKNGLRLLFLILTLLPLAAGLTIGLIWFDPYSIFGRIAVNVFSPVYNFGNNILHALCKAFHINCFYHVGIYWQSIPATIVGLASFGLIFCLAWRFGRIWCNAVCPVGTILGLLSKYSLFRIRIDKSKCTRCGLCAGRCKSSCINSKEQEVDSSRCVNCFNCLGVCRQKAISWTVRGNGSGESETIGSDKKNGSAAKNSSQNHSLTKPNTSRPQTNTDPVNENVSLNGIDQGKREFLTVMAVLSTAALTAPAQAANEKLKEIGSSAAPPAAGQKKSKETDHSQTTEKEAAKNSVGTKGSVQQGSDKKTSETNSENVSAGKNGSVKTGKKAQDVKAQAEKPTEPGNIPQYGKTPFTRQYPITPPGSISLDRFNKLCTACHLCIGKCPSNVLRPSVLEYGLKGFLQPRVDFTRGFCNYDCTVCSEVCPAEALIQLTLEQKHRNQMGRVVFIKENCIVYAEETSCGACSEHCPTQAVAMVPYKNEDLTIPEINPDICVGCGGCEFICPARPYRAIYVEGNPTHQERKEFKVEKKKEVKLDDFGF